MRLRTDAIVFIPLMPFSSVLPKCNRLAVSSGRSLKYFLCDFKSITLNKIFHIVNSCAEMFDARFVGILLHGKINFVHLHSNIFKLI